MKFESLFGPRGAAPPIVSVVAQMGPTMLASGDDLLANRSNRQFSVKGRLKPGVSMAAANAEIAALAKSLEQSYPATNRAFGAALRTELQARLDNDPGTPLMIGVLFAIVLVALLIACANVANLMLGRGHARAREIAVRLAIGASRVRLVRQLMAESLLIALTGGALGVLIAEFSADALSTLQIPGDIPIVTTVQLDARALWFTVLVSLSTAMLFGLAPALQSTKSDLAPTLKAGPSDQNRKRFFGRNALVTAQIVGSVVLLVAATQLFLGFDYLLSHNPGFLIDHRLTMSFDPGLVRYTPERTDQFYKLLMQRVREVPGVKTAALGSSIPLNNWRVDDVIPEGYQFPRGQASVRVWASTIDEHYFQTMGVPLRQGRGFESTDRADSVRVAIVNELFARRYLGPNAIGKRLRLNPANGPWVEIVGVAANSKYATCAFRVLPPLRVRSPPRRRRGQAFAATAA